METSITRLKSKFEPLMVSIRVETEEEMEVLSQKLKASVLGGLRYVDRNSPRYKQLLKISNNLWEFGVAVENQGIDKGM